jgi:adenine-specific DNA methylase
MQGHLIAFIILCILLAIMNIVLFSYNTTLENELTKDMSYNTYVTNISTNVYNIIITSITYEQDDFTFIVDLYDALSRDIKKGYAKYLVFKGHLFSIVSIKGNKLVLKLIGMKKEYSNLVSNITQNAFIFCY